MKGPATIVFMAAALVFIGCGDDTLKGEPVSFNTLNGTYDVNQNCSIVVNESQVRTTGCSTENFDVSGTGTVSEASASVTAVATTTSVPFECYQLETCTTNVDGSASKSESRTEDGPFSPFAGVWSGSVTFETTCAESEPVDPLPDFCGEPREETDTVLYNFGLDVFGRAATITYDGPETGSIDIVGTDTAIEVDGDRVERL